MTLRRDRPATTIVRNALIPVCICAFSLACVTAVNSAVAGDTAAPREQAKDTPTIRLVEARDIGDLIDRARGSVVVVNFWATWCPPCVQEMPALVEFYPICQERGIRFLSISADHPSTIDERVRPFVTEHRLPFPVHVMTDNGPEELDKVLGLGWEGGLPATFVYGRDGKMAHSWLEEVTLDDLVEVTAPLLNDESKDGKH